MDGGGAMMSWTPRTTKARGGRTNAQAEGCTFGRVSGWGGAEPKVQAKIELGEWSGVGLDELESSFTSEADLVQVSSLSY